MNEPEDGMIIRDTFELSDFVNWLRRSTRDRICILVSERKNGQPLIPIKHIRSAGNGRALVVELPNHLQSTSRTMLDTVNPYLGASRIFPPGDSWCTDFTLVPFIQPQLTEDEYLRQISDCIDAIERPRVARTEPAEDSSPSEETSLADVRVREDMKWYLIDETHVDECVGSILSMNRDIPVILVSKSPWYSKPFIDVEALAEAVGDGAIIFEIKDEATSRLLYDKLPHWARAYHGAVRFIPFDAMDANGAGTKLCRIRGVAESKQTVEELVDRVNEDLSSSEYDSYGLDESETDEDSGKNRGVANTESVGTEDSDSGKTDSASAVPKKKQERSCGFWKQVAHTNASATKATGDMVEAYVKMILEGDVPYVQIPGEMKFRKVNVAGLTREVAEAFVNAGYEPEPGEGRMYPSDWILCAGQHVRGWLDGPDGFILDADWVAAQQALRHYTSGKIVAGVVTFVCDDMFKLMLYPGIGDNPPVEVTIQRADFLSGTHIAPDTDLRPVLHKGQAIAVKIISRERRDILPDDEWLCALPSQNETEVVEEPPSLLPDGPSWLWINPKLIATIPHKGKENKQSGGSNPFAYMPFMRSKQTLTAVPFKDLLESTATLASAHETMRTLYEQLADSQQRNEKLEQENKRLNGKNQKLREQSKGAAKMLDDTNPITSFEGHFDTLQEELDWMIRAQSLLQFTTAERAKRPLDDWSYGPNFFDSLRECEHGNMSHASLIRTMVFVLMGNEATQKGLQQHRLREGRGGDDADRLDEEGNVIYRVTVHGQYRLHYTRDAVNHVKFLSVNTHDELLR